MRTLQECNEITVKHMMVLHVSVMYDFTCKHVCNTCIIVRGIPYLVDSIRTCFTHACIRYQFS